MYAGHRDHHLSSQIWSTPVGYEIIYPGGAYRESLADIWIRSTVPDQADESLFEVEANEYPNPWWDAINGTGNFDKVTWPSVMWAGWCVGGGGVPPPATVLPAPSCRARPSQVSGGLRVQARAG